MKQTYKEVLLDKRTAQDLRRRMEELAASYTPEWRFDVNDPDVGSTLGMIFTAQMADNIRRMNQLPEKYHTEFANLLGLTLHPAYPASGVAEVKLMRGTIPGIALLHGTRLTASAPDGAQLLFETTGDVYITNARMTDVLSVSGLKGRICPLLGDLQPAALQPLEAASAEGAALMEDLPAPDTPQVQPFLLFDYEEAGIEKNALLLYHRHMFAGPAGFPLQLQLFSHTGEPVCEALADPARYRWSYYSAEGMKPFDVVRAEGDFLELVREGESKEMQLDGNAYHMICLEALEPVTEALVLQDIRVSSKRDPAEPEMILHNGEVLEAGECLPFGDTVSLFDECYICDDQVFSQQEATVELSFMLSVRRKVLQLTPEQASDELKVIKKKPRAVQYTVAETSPQRIALEYFNGQVWKRIPESRDWGALFDGSSEGGFRLAFTCPADWSPVSVNGYEGRCLRVMVTQADNCYLLPCEHTMPVLKNVGISYLYTGVLKQPQRVRTVCGTKISDQTQALLKGNPVTAFNPLSHPAAALYLGLDRPLEGAPVSILFEVEENVHFHMEPVTFEYSTRTGFKPMKVLDNTRNFSAAGTVLFMPPSDFAPSEVEGLRRWWLRIKGSEKAVQGYHARVNAIRLNAVNIRNQQTQPEETFYVDVTIPNLTFRLAAQNILSAEVFVSELGQLSRHQMRRMLEESPQDVRVEYDFLGEITSFFVRWQEVDSFDRSTPTDRHYMIDRARSTLVFGDGVHVRIPQAQPNAAVVVRAVSCDGTRGNVPAGAVDSFYGNVMYVESVTNPIATSAGNDLEDLESARKRGADMISSRGRLISQRDFVRAVETFSSAIEKVKCLAGYDIDGVPDPDRITIAVMTEDYAAGAQAFHSIREGLCRLLLEKCDAAITPENLVVSEPIYVEISVVVWVKADDAARAFDVQNLVSEHIRGFLDPLPSGIHGGWDIGVLPSGRQLKMLLQSLQFQGHVERVIASARYVDREGVHETSLDELPVMPFAIGINGEHRVYIEFQ